MVNVMHACTIVQYAAFVLFGGKNSLNKSLHLIERPSAACATMRVSEWKAVAESSGNAEKNYFCTSRARSLLYLRRLTCANTFAFRDLSTRRWRTRRGEEKFVLLDKYKSPMEKFTANFVQSN